jgi:hypothetical protein
MRSPLELNKPRDPVGVKIVLRELPKTPRTALSPAEDSRLPSGCTCEDQRQPCAAKLWADPSARPMGTPVASPRTSRRLPPVVNIANSSPVAADNAARSDWAKPRFGMIALLPKPSSCASTDAWLEFRSAAPAAIARNCEPLVEMLSAAKVQLYSASNGLTVPSSLSTRKTTGPSTGFPAGLNTSKTAAQCLGVEFALIPAHSYRHPLISRRSTWAMASALASISEIAFIESLQQNRYTSWRGFAVRRSSYSSA